MHAWVHAVWCCKVNREETKSKTLICFITEQTAGPLLSCRACVTGKSCGKQTPS